jgi:hypothetical protein
LNGIDEITFLLENFSLEKPKRFSSFFFMFLHFRGRKCCRKYKNIEKLKNPKTLKKSEN